MKRNFTKPLSAAACLGIFCLGVAACTGAAANQAEAAGKAAQINTETQAGPGVQLSAGNAGTDANSANASGSADSGTGANSANTSGSTSSADLKLFQMLDFSKNTIYSPYSFADAMHLVYPAAGGTTKAELENALGFNADTTAAFDAYDKSMSLDKDGYGLSIANRAFLNQNKAGLVNTSVIPNAMVQQIPMNSEGQSAIDRFVNEQTRGMIPTMDCGLDESQVMVLMNALYFNRLWADSSYSGYDKDTQKLVWTDGTARTAFGGSAALTDIKEVNSNIDAIRIPYKKSADTEHQFSLIAICDSDSVSGTHVYDYVRQLTPEAFDRLVDFSNNSAIPYDEADFVLPEFTIENTHILTDAARSLGLGTALSGGADFAKLGPVYISEILQKAKIEVTKEGTKAAAATGLIMKTTSLIENEPTVKHVSADSYFVYVLRDETAGRNLFIGSVANPQK